MTCEALTAPDSVVREPLKVFLADRSTESDNRWRRWCAVTLDHGSLRPPDLAAWWTVIEEFDPVLSRYAAQPVPTPPGTVVVAGSGKEHFKTFNVSTAAAILAAAAGTPVVKGISRSVSAISGAADILDVLGIQPVADPVDIPRELLRHNIVFVAYPSFCPQYADRYDGVFDLLSPASFFMPVAAMRVNASAFVLGLAHHDVTLAAAALRLIRPDIPRGFVVSTELTPGETVDEACEIGTVRTAQVARDHIVSSRRQNPAPTTLWRQAVAHRPTHQGNAALVAESLAPADDTPVSRLVETNAALIVRAGDKCPAVEAAARVRRARISGAAAHLLTALAELRHS